jgi:hypothetical protein
LLIRARPLGTWRSNQYKYVPLAEWLPDAALGSVSFEEARTWLVRRYAATFGPVTFEDVCWWTGFSKRQVQEAIRSLGAELETVGVEGLEGQYFMLGGDVQRLANQSLPDGPYAFLLPALDPYIMGYQERRRFLADEHHAKVFDRAGNAVPTVWVNGRVVGAWGQQQNGRVVQGLFERIGAPAQALIAEEAQRLDNFLEGEVLPQRSHTPFTRALQDGHLDAVQMVREEP